jgi:hypothetical protein
MNTLNSWHSAASALTIELPDNLEAALKAQANAQGISEAGYVRTLLERDPAASTAKYGPAPTAEEGDANRADMFRHGAE